MGGVHTCAEHAQAIENNNVARIMMFMLLQLSEFSPKGEPFFFLLSRDLCRYRPVKCQKMGLFASNLFDSFAGGHRRTAGHISANTAPMSAGLGQCRS